MPVYPCLFSYSMCTMSCVVHKVQSRFLVKQEVRFYLCCTEQLLEILNNTKQNNMVTGWWKKKTLGKVNKYGFKRGSKILWVQTSLEVNKFWASIWQDEQRSLLMNWRFWCMKHCVTDFMHKTVESNTSKTTAAFCLLMQHLTFHITTALHLESNHGSKSKQFVISVYYTMKNTCGLGP